MSEAKPLLTPWTLSSEREPEIVGEYMASVRENERVRRWWNGKNWSRCYFENDSLEFRCRMASLAANPNLNFSWRGLGEKPEGFVE